MYSLMSVALQNAEPVVVKLNDSKVVYSGMINNIAIEDGSGKNWLVTLCLTSSGYKTLLIKAQ